MFRSRLILVVAFLGITPAALAQTEHHVPADFSTIQAAIEAAQDGDAVIVAPGTYVEPIGFLGKAIRVRSSDGPEVTTIHGSVGFGSGEGPDSLIEGFTVTGGGPGIWCSWSSPTIRDCAIVENTGGGVSVTGGGCSPIFISCVIRGNTAPPGWPLGGGMVNERSSPQLQNCIFNTNSAVYGGGMANLNASPYLVNCTFHGNQADFGNGMFNASLGWPYPPSGSHPAIEACIFWGDDDQIVDDPNSAAFVDRCIVQGGYPGWLIYGDPRFVDADGADDVPGTEDDDLHLLPSSPAINSSMITSTSGWLADTDFEGDERVGCGVVDIGADEFVGCPPGAFVRGDANGDGVIDIADPIYNLDYLIGVGPSICLDAQDTNDDGVVDIADPIHNLSHQFSLGPNELPWPYPLCGVDSFSVDDLDCQGPMACP